MEVTIESIDVPNTQSFMPAALGCAPRSGPDASTITPVIGRRGASLSERGLRRRRQELEAYPSVMFLRPVGGAEGDKDGDKSEALDVPHHVVAMKERKRLGGRSTMARAAFVFSLEGLCEMLAVTNRAWCVRRGVAPRPAFPSGSDDACQASWSLLARRLPYSPMPWRLRLVWQGIRWSDVGRCGVREPGTLLVDVCSILHVLVSRGS